MNEKQRAKKAIAAVMAEAEKLERKAELLREEAKITPDLDEQADRLTEAYIAEIRAEATKAAAQAFAKAYETAEIETKKEKRK